MQHNSGINTHAADALTANDISRYAQASFSLQVTGAIAADAVFNVMYHDDDGTGAPGAAQQVANRDLDTQWLGSAGTTTNATITVPAGTAVGTFVGAGLMGKPGKFVSLVAASGDTANVRATTLLEGPRPV